MRSDWDWSPQFSKLTDDAGTLDRPEREQQIPERQMGMNSGWLSEIEANAADGRTTEARPTMPPESLSRCRPTFQFPKTLLLPLLSCVAAMKDAGWLSGAPVRQHVVICGFPRSGTTLCQLMLESCLDNVATWGRERRALEIARCGRRTHSVIVTKRPKDLFLIPEIQHWYSQRGTDVRFLLMHRDPRAVLTSKHFSRPDEYFLSIREWTHYFAHWKWSVGLPDVLSVSYEDLVLDPDRTESRIRQFTGLHGGRPFRDFQRHVPEGFDLRALNGLRSLDSARLNSWRDEAHRDRIMELRTELPQLQESLVMMGYESDNSWSHDYAIPAQSPVAA